MYYPCSNALFKEEWMVLLNDEEVINDLAIELLSVLIYHFDGCAAASEISRYTGRSYQAYNRVSQRVVLNARKKGYVFPPHFRRDGKERHWIHLFNGEKQPNRFQWIVGSHLREAFLTVYPKSEFETIFKKRSTGFIER